MAMTIIDCARKADFLAVKFRLKEGVSVNTRCEHDGSTALHFAVQQGNIEAVEMLISKGARPTVPNKKGERPIYIAAKYGRLDLVRALIEKYAKYCKSIDLDKPDLNLGFTPLLAAASNNHFDVVEYLLLRGADFRKKANDGTSLLHFAAQYGHVDLVSKLLSVGAEMEALQYHEDKLITPLLKAVENGHIPVLNAFFEKGTRIGKQYLSKSELLYHAIEKMQLEVLEFLLKIGVRPDGWISTGDDTPLTLAIRNRCDDAVIIMLNAKANPNYAGRNGTSPLRLAVEQGSIEAVQKLLEYGADAAERGSDLLSPSEIAQRMQEPRLIEIFERVAPIQNKA